MDPSRPKFLLMVLLLAPSIAAKSLLEENSPGRLTDLFIPGEFPVNRTSYKQLVTLNLDTNLDVYAPIAAGNFPVFYFVTGFGGTIPGDAHSLVLSHIASHGFVVVAAWRVASPVASFDPTWFDLTADFVERRLERDLQNNQGYDPDFHVDYLNSFMGCHSAGSKIAVIELMKSCRNYQGLILIDPVDGNSPNPENVTMSVITPGEKVNFTVPTLQIVTGLDPVPDPFGVACAPEELSGLRYFDAMTGPTWYVNATDYGHLDFLDPGFIVNINGAAKLCPANPDDTVMDEYIQFVSGEILSFMNGFLDPVGNCDLFDNLETNGLVGVNTLNDFAANGWERCTPLKCSKPSFDPFFSFW